jgi:uncharacterized delta-60 repeat protein
MMNGKIFFLCAAFFLSHLALPARAGDSPTVVPAPAGASIWGFDRSFGVNGFVYFQPTKLVDGSFEYPHFRAFLLPDGKTLVDLEYHFDYGGKAVDEESLALRFESHGELEKEVGFSGRWIAGIQPDGRMIIADFDFTGQRLVLGRYNEDFSLDPEFHFAEEADLGNTFLGAVQSNGKIIFAGGMQNDTVYRLNSDGSLDGTLSTDIGPFNHIEEIVSHTNSSFLIEEWETVPLHCSARVYSEGGAYIGFLYQTYSGTPGNFCSFVDFTPYPDGGFVWSHYREDLYKSKADAALDAGFGDAGKVSVDPGAGNEVVTAHYHPVVQPDGKILVSGLLENSSGTWPFIARYNPDGQLDNTFGSSGRFILYVPMDERPDLLLQEDGKILLAGPSGENFILVRLQENPVNNWLYLPLVR